jgi:tRNA G18 (ribose-2'-O)-methylase SpoU
MHGSVQSLNVGTSVGIVLAWIKKEG